MKLSSGLGVCVLFGLGSACSDDGGDAQAAAKLAPVKGVAAVFNDAGTGRIADATVSVLEHPEMQMTAGADGLFSFDGLHEGQDVTLVLEHPDYPLIQTGTHTLPPGGIDDLTFQVPSKPIYDLLASVVAVTPDPSEPALSTRSGGAATAVSRTALRRCARCCA